MNISVKLSEDMYRKLKWLKNRYQSVNQRDMSWDEFFNDIIEDNMIILAYKIKKKTPDLTLEAIQALLFGSYMSIDEIATEDRMLLMKQLGITRGD